MIPAGDSSVRIRVASLEDSAPLRESLRGWLSSHARLRLLGVWGTLPELLAGLEREPADVVLMDLRLGDSMDGIRGTAEVRRRFPATMVLVLTLFDEPRVVFEALNAGAVGYLLKGAEPATLLAAIEEVAAGGAPMTGAIARLVIERFHQAPPGGGDAELLSRREIEVLGALASGCRYKEVADRLGVSHNTIRSHVRRIFEKLHAHGVMEAVRRARGAGIRLPE